MDRSRLKSRRDLFFFAADDVDSIGYVMSVIETENAEDKGENSIYHV